MTSGMPGYNVAAPTDPRFQGDLSNYNHVPPGARDPREARYDPRDPRDPFYGQPYQAAYPPGQYGEPEYRGDPRQRPDPNMMIDPRDPRARVDPRDPRLQDPRFAPPQAYYAPQGGRGQPDYDYDLQMGGIPQGGYGVPQGGAIPPGYAGPGRGYDDYRPGRR